MNIIEMVKSIILQFPKISEVCNDIHVDFTDDVPTNYGLSSTGDSIVKESVIGDQIRQHNFLLYAVFQSVNDYDRMSNSGTLLELSYWLERQAQNQELIVDILNEKYVGELLSLSTANGMLYSIPSENLNNGIQYQLQIIAKYKLFEREEF